MLQAGTRQTLYIVKILSFGAYLGEYGPRDAGTDAYAKQEEVLLPAKELAPDAKSGDALSVFLYLDSEDRLIATMRTPKIMLHQVARLVVRQVGKIGAFMDWGLEKDVLLPYAEQTRKVRAEEEILCALYADKSGRLCVTMNVYPYLEKRSPYRKDMLVSGTVYETSDNFGLFVAVDDRYSALIPKRECYGTLPQIGDTVSARVVSLKEDGRLTLSLRRKAYLQMEDDAAVLAERLKKDGGILRDREGRPLTEESDPERIREELRMSKAAFKRALGRLYKEARIEITKEEIRLRR